MLMKRDFKFQVKIGGCLRSNSMRFLGFPIIERGLVNRIILKQDVSDESSALRKLVSDLKKY